MIIYNEQKIGHDARAPEMSGLVLPQARYGKGILHRHIERSI